MHKLKNFLVAAGLLILLFSIMIKFSPASSALKKSFTPSGLLAYANAFFLLAVLIKLHEVAVRVNAILHNVREPQVPHLPREGSH